jgi:hypothetical protein
MADKIIKLKIDVSKIDKAKLFAGKNGAKYLDATFLYNDATDQYGNNGMIVQDISKEERLAGAKGAILGNGKVFQSNSTPTPAAKANPNPWPTAGYSDPNDDLPF